MTNFILYCFLWQILDSLFCMGGTRDQETEWAKNVNLNSLDKRSSDN